MHQQAEHYEAQRYEIKGVEARETRWQSRVSRSICREGGKRGEVRTGVAGRSCCPCQKSITLDKWCKEICADDSEMNPPELACPQLKDETSHFYMLQVPAVERYHICMQHPRAQCRAVLCSAVQCSASSLSSSDQPPYQHNL